MIFLPNIRIRPKLVFLFVCTGLIPLLIVSFFSSKLASDALLDKSFSQLVSIQAIRKTQVEHFFKQQYANIQIMANSPLGQGLLDTLNGYYADVAPYGQLSRPDVSSVKYLNNTAALRVLAQEYLQANGYQNMLIIEGTHGHVVFSVVAENALGTSLRHGPYKGSALARVWQEAVETRKTAVVDFEAYAPHGGEQALFIGQPVFERSGTLKGVIVYQISPELVTSIVDSTKGMGETGESYLVSVEAAPWRNSFRSKLKTMGTGQYVVGYSLPNTLEYWKDAQRHGEAGGKNLYVDSVGQAVLVTFNKLAIQGLDWYLISKVDRYEVMASVRETNKLIGFIAAILLALIGVGSLYFSKTFSGPVIASTKFAQAIAGGDLDATIELDQKDELGDLARALNGMALNLRNFDWLKSGREALDNEMRGEHHVDVLIKRFIKLVTQHLGAQLGAIYILENEELVLKSSYAFTDRKGAFNSFKMGEGMVGQAALEKEISLFSNLTEDVPAFNYGTGETVPKHFMAVPIVFENELFGVFMLGSIVPFTLLHQQFVNQNAENVGILLNAAKSRDTIRDLLTATQEQQQKLSLANAELEEQARALKESEAELQAQQEELRVTNEELEEQTRALKESETELQAQQEELRVTNEELESYTQSLEQQKEAIRKKNNELIVAQDVVKKKAHDLELASKYKSEFLANMSHELRTPLNSILILSQLLSNNKDGNLTDKQVESVKAVNSSGSDLLTLINEILDLSKVEAGRIEILVEDLSLDDAVADINRLFQDVAADKGVLFDIIKGQDVPAVIKTDSQRLHQVLRNLLTNAFKFTDKGLVSLEIDNPSEKHTPEWLSRESALAFSVQDTGIGIPKAQQLAIFEAFQQADGSTCRKYGGTGLGLSISRELTKLLGGAIYLESEEGKGSTFTVVLPLEPVPAVSLDPGVTLVARTDEAMPRIQAVETIEAKPLEELGEPVESAPVAAAATIQEKSQMISSLSVERVEDDRNNLSSADRALLIIEDDPTFSKVLRDFARERGFKCLLAEDGETGLHFADYYKPSAIILDIGLPGIDGWTVMERLKDNPALRHIPVHFMSAADSSLDAMRMGAVGFLSKPVSMEKVDDAFQRIENIISKPVAKLLVVEDDDVQRNSIQQLIGNGDVETTGVATGMEAFLELEKGGYDCMVLDLGLADMSGFDLLEKIRLSETITRVPIIVYTGRDLTREEERKLDRYTESIIIKGVKSPERLLDETALFLHRVEFDLPEGKQRMLKMAHDKEAVLADKTILLVDDDMRNLFALSNVLEEKAMDVIIARNGIEALEKLKTGKKVDLILMDIMMPQMDGYEAMREIRKERQYAKLPIIALTAKAMKGDRSKCIEAGANDYFPKPVNIEKLLSMLRVWLY